MGQYTSYWLYQRFEARDGQTIPVYPNVWSVDADGTMNAVVKLDNDPACGYDPRPVQYRWVNLDPTKDYYCDECETITVWEKSSDTVCVEDPTPTPQYRTLTTATTCVGYDLHVLEEYQVSYDYGETWTTTGTSTGSLIEADSPTCGYVPPTPDPYANQYFTIVGHAGTVRFRSFNAATYYYSKDSGETWNTGSQQTQISLRSNEKVMFKANITSSKLGKFEGGDFDVEGNIMSLLYGDNFTGQTSLPGINYLFNYLFEDCEGLFSAANLVLPATTLPEGCYVGMFYGCTNLTTAPSVLPATTLAYNCYGNMFFDCASLTTTPALPATTLAEGCYYGMFEGCTSLTTAPELPATTLVASCYKWMFLRCTSLTQITCLATDISASDCTEEWVENVASNGTFTKAASMTDWETGWNGIPSNWTVQDYNG